MDTPADEVLRRLLAAVEAQLAAARTANTSALAASTEERRALQEALDLDAIRASDGATRAEAARIASQIRALDHRLRTCGESVLAAFDSLQANPPPPTYGRRGQLRSFV